jgi:hypothetical protein
MILSNYFDKDLIEKRSKSLSNIQLTNGLKMMLVNGLTKSDLVTVFRNLNLIILTVRVYLH